MPSVETLDSEKLAVMPYGTFMAHLQHPQCNFNPWLG